MTDRGMHQVGFEKQGEAHDRGVETSEGGCGQRGIGHAVRGGSYGWAVAIPVTFSK